MHAFSYHFITQKCILQSFLKDCFESEVFEQDSDLQKENCELKERVQHLEKLVAELQTKVANAEDKEEEKET